MTETNLTTSTDLVAQSIDFVEQFSGGIQTLLNALGVIRMQPMTTGSQIKIYKSEVTKVDGNVAEGEVIPLSKVTRKLANTLTLGFKKYRKVTTIEAIQSAGGATPAIVDTDNKLLREIQKDVKKDLFDYITKSDANKTTASGDNFQKALAAAFCQCYDINIDLEDLSRLARIGSGSASRSVYGGFAVWQKGNSDETSYAYALDETPTMDLHLLAVELNTKQKKISSTYGMKDAQSSPFFRPWLERNDSELNEMIKAIKSNDFTALGQLAELNANEMHAINLTAQPEFTYFEPQTIQAIKLVEQLRTEGIECYYTIDAGPNIKVLCQLRNSKDIIQRFSSEFNNVNIVNASFGPGITYLD